MGGCDAVKTLAESGQFFDIFRSSVARERAYLALMTTAAWISAHEEELQSDASSSISSYRESESD